MIILRNARLVPYLTEGFNGEYADIVVDGGVIQNILEAGSCNAATGDVEIDASGRTVLPGLVDLHMHLCFSSANTAEFSAQTQNQMLIGNIDAARLYLRRGYTTIRDCGNAWYTGVAVRDAVNAGIVPGPRIITAGNCITPTAAGNESMPELHTEIDNPSELLGACRREIANGADFIKYMATGSVLNLRGEPGALVTTQEELNAIQKAAESLGTYVAVHCHGTEGIKCCIRAGIRTIEHASFLDDECIMMLKEEDCRSSLVPTLSPVVEISEDADGVIPEYLKDKIRQIFDAASMLVRAERAGILIGWGTDSTVPFVRSHPGYEFYARHKIGFSNEEILKQATVNSARIVGMNDQIGSIGIGKYADLVIYDGRPDEDILIMTKEPDMVISNGKLID